MSNYPVHVAFPGRLIFVGFGSIGQGVLPLILRHVGIQPDQITIVTAEEAGDLRSRFLPMETTYPAIARWIERMGSLPGYERTYPPHWREGAPRG